MTRLPRDKVKAQALSLLVGDLVDQRVFVQVPLIKVGKGFSRFFLVQKPMGKFYLILNLKQLNPFIKYKRFRRIESLFCQDHLTPIFVSWHLLL